MASVIQYNYLKELFIISLITTFSILYFNQAEASRSCQQLLKINKLRSKTKHPVTRDSLEESIDLLVYNPIGTSLLKIAHSYGNLWEFGIDPTKKIGSKSIKKMYSALKKLKGPFSELFLYHLKNLFSILVKRRKKLDLPGFDSFPYILQSEIEFINKYRNIYLNYQSYLTFQKYSTFEAFVGSIRKNGIPDLPKLSAEDFTIQQYGKEVFLASKNSDVAKKAGKTFLMHITPVERLQRILSDKYLIPGKSITEGEPKGIGLATNSYSWVFLTLTSLSEMKIFKTVRSCSHCYADFPFVIILLPLTTLDRHDFRILSGWNHGKENEDVRIFYTNTKKMSDFGHKGNPNNFISLWEFLSKYIGDQNEVLSKNRVPIKDDNIYFYGPKSHSSEIENVLKNNGRDPGKFLRLY